LKKMSNALRQYIRESLLLREEEVAEPEKDFPFERTEDLSQNPELEAVRDSYSYIENHSDISSLPNSLNIKIGGLGYYLSRDDMKSATDGLLTALMADKEDIGNTLYPYRTALFLQGLEKGQMTSLEGFVEIAGGLLLPALQGIYQGTQSLRVDENFFTRRLSKIYKALPGVPGSSLRGAGKFIGSPASALAKEIESVAGGTLRSFGGNKDAFLSDSAKYLLDLDSKGLENVDLVTSELAIRAKKQGLEAYDLANPAEITDDFKKFAKAAIDKAAEMLPFKARAKVYGGMAFRASLLSSALGFPLTSLPADTVISPETALALVTSYTIRKETQKAIKSLIDYFGDSSFWGSAPDITTGEMVEILRSKAMSSALPAPGGAYAVTAEQLQALIDLITAKGATLPAAAKEG
jgi:hypothetical protein